MHCGNLSHIANVGNEVMVCWQRLHGNTETQQYSLHLNLYVPQEPTTIIYQLSYCQSC
jgi:hypothetical protein